MFDLLDWKFYSAVVFIFNALAASLYKKAQSQGARPGSFLVIQAPVFFSTVLAASLFWDQFRFDNPYLLLGFLCSVLGVTGAFFSLRSMKHGELGTSTAIIRLSFVPTAIGAILFLSEPLTLQKGAILLCAGLAVFLFFDHYRTVNRIGLRSIVPALTACLSFGLLDLVYKFSATHGVNPLALLIVQSGTSNILINVYVFSYEKYQINKAILRTAPLCGILLAAGCVAFLKALRGADVSLISPFIQMNFILAYLLGAIFFKEQVTKNKLVGIALVVLAILML